jgi:carbon-monoxide dehydrogenase large subunit
MARTAGGIGAGVARKEDYRLLTGGGSFVADIPFPGALHCVIVRSPHAHARIRSIDVSAAAAARGVRAVFIGADLDEDGVGPMRSGWAVAMPGGPPMAEPLRRVLALDTVRHVGEAVAAVIADSSASAEDAAELVVVEYEPLPAVVSARAALEAGAPLLHRDAPGNRCFRWTRGDPAAVESALAGAARIVAIDLVNHRVCGAAIEPRGAVGLYDARSGRATLYCSTQTPHHIRHYVAAELKLDEARLRVVSPDVGGGFGYKGKHYPEETLVVWAARRFGLPVRWIATRQESFLSDTQGRDHHSRAELALGVDGRFLGLRVRTVANIGAYVSTFGAAIPGPIYSALLAGVYRTPAIFVEVVGAFSNTLPTDAYRGAGRPEACYLLERLADRAARELGMDRAEIRRRNLVPAEMMPYRTPIGPTYDCGDFPRVFERALTIAGYGDFVARKELAAARGRLRGIGIACYVESSGVAPSRLAGMMGARGGFYESATVRVASDGSVLALLGTHSHGQGHATTFAQILAEKLGVPLDRIEVVEGDTDVVPIGTGTFGSRSMAVGGAALERAAARIVAKGRRIAAHLLEAAATDIAFSSGEFRVVGTDRRVTFADVAHAAYVPHRYPLDQLEPGLDETAFYDPANFAFTNGAHVCELEIDPETGAVAIAGYWAVDDIGTVINPVIVAGQLHGGVAQGIGQALAERAAYDAQSGQIVSATFMDYALPRATDLPMFAVETDESQPCTHNPLGAKGCGESGAIAAPAAVVGAVLDALGPLGVYDIEMPVSAERIWRAIRDAASRAKRS